MMQDAEGDDQIETSQGPQVSLVYFFREEGCLPARMFFPGMMDVLG